MDRDSAHLQMKRLDYGEALNTSCFGSTWVARESTFGVSRYENELWELWLHIHLTCEIYGLSFLELIL